MKLTNIFTVLFLIALLFSCETENESSIPESKTIQEIQEIDSTAFYDSIYEPYKYAIDTFFLNKHKLTEFYGTVLIAEKGRIVFQNSYGYANLKTKDTLTLEHTFQLASASKPFTAIAMMQLVEQGKVNLTDDVKKFIPNFPYEGIDIHQLLCHRSGLSQYTHFCDAPDSIWSDKHQTINNNDVLNIMEKYIPIVNYAPNQTHYYCNTNYMLLATIVEKVSGITFKDYLKKYIFEPSGMKSTVLYKRDNTDELINPTLGYNGAFNPEIDIYLNGVVGDKGIYSNIHDLLAFDKALYENKLISNTTMQLIMQNHNEMQNNGQNYGYGFRIYPESEMGRIVFHTGWWKGFRTYFIRIPESQKTVIVLSHIKRGKFFDVKELAKLSKLED
jgi:CubicO group peptidase (beta-lactamase class C family)